MPGSSLAFCLLEGEVVSRQPVWITSSGPGDKAEWLLAFLESVAVEGLDPDEYFVDRMRSLWNSKKVSDLARLEILLTSSLGRYVNDVRVGSVKPRRLDSKLFAGAHTNQVSPMVLVKQALTTFEAVKRFQDRYQLKADGAVGKGTIAKLNIPVKQIVRKIIINMERWRWVNRSAGADVLAVNIAGFYLAAARNNRVEFNPYWNIPGSIAKNEMLPKLKKNPGYLNSKNIELFDSWNENAKPLDSTQINWTSVTPEKMNNYRLRQKSGPSNALGRVKFIFPNSHNVYLHDTPSRGLFSQTKRAFSHGCIRVGKPLELASYLLGGEAAGWGSEKIEKIVTSGERKVVNLKTPYPVYILYRTVVFGLKGGLLIHEDIYGRDKLLEQAFLLLQQIPIPQG